MEVYLKWKCILAFFREVSRYYLEKYKIEYKINLEMKINPSKICCSLKEKRAQSEAQSKIQLSLKRDI